MSTFGPIVSGSQVEAAVKDTLSGGRSDQYLAEVERVLGHTAGHYPHIRHVTSTSELESAEVGQLPALVIESTGIVETTRKGDGTYDGKFNVGIVVAVDGRDSIDARQSAQDYAAAICEVLLHRQSLGGLARAVQFDGETYLDFPGTDESEQRGEAILRFTVDVPNIRNSFGMPNRDDEIVPHPDHHDDPGDWPEVETADAVVHPQSE